MTEPTWGTPGMVRCVDCRYWTDPQPASGLVFGVCRHPSRRWEPEWNLCQSEHAGCTYGRVSKQRMLL